MRRLMRSSPRSVSMSLHRRPHISPGRAPVTAARWRYTANSGSCSRAAANMRRTAAGFGVAITAFGTSGGRASAATFVVAHPHRTACASAARTIVWALRIDAGLSPLSRRRCVPALQIGDAELAQRHVAERRKDVQSDVARVHLAGRLTGGPAGRQPLLDDLRNRGVARVLRAVLGLRDQLVQEAVGGALGLRRAGQHAGLPVPGSRPSFT